MLRQLHKSKLLRVLFSLSFFISGIVINLIQFSLYLTIRFINKKLYRKLNYYLIYTLWSRMYCLSICFIIQFLCNISVINWMIGQKLWQWVSGGRSQGFACFSMISKVLNRMQNTTPYMWWTIDTNWIGSGVGWFWISLEPWEYDCPHFDI